MFTAQSIPTLLAIAWLLPLASFTVIVLLGRGLGQSGRLAGWLATGAIVAGFLLSATSLVIWTTSEHLNATGGPHREALQPGEHGEYAESSQTPSIYTLVAGESAPRDTADSGEQRAHGDAGELQESQGASHGHQAAPVYYAGDWYALGVFGKLRITIGYYVDALTVAMFCMVTLIASCIHFYSMGYMHDEQHEFTDPEVTLENGEKLTRRGRYHRFFQYLSLFCFSMLGVVVSGNIAMVFVFWELVGICSYFLIGFYIERQSASNAANKAFIVNRVGDFGMIIGLMALWGSLGTFSFGDMDLPDGARQAGIFSLVRPATLDGQPNEHRLAVPDAMVQWSAKDEVAQVVREHADDPQAAQSQIDAQTPEWRAEGFGYWLLIVAGIGIFCGCVGKSAQFPLHVWLPDAMEGPTPVSALVHSATMVAAGVYLVARFFPVFTPEVLLVIAYVGCITLFLAATIAITATDIKRVLAYSTVSQLGYMMLALGLGGWIAGVFHLITHAFFKSLLFMCSGSVIHAVHSNELTEMGGLLKKMPITAITMLVGCLAIIGAGIPSVGIGFSGYYSKDAILEQAWSYASANPLQNALFLVPAAAAAITAFYMFRLWYMAFLGTPRNQHRYEHAHESPMVMTGPLVVLALFALAVAWPVFGVADSLLESARPAGTLATVEKALVMEGLTIPSEHDSHADEVRVPAGLTAFGTAAAGFLLASVIYWWRLLDPNEIRRQFRPIHRFLINKWWFDELYWAVLVRPLLFVAQCAANFDKKIIDGLIDGTARVTTKLANVWDAIVDRRVVDGLFNGLAYGTWDVALSLRRLQTGKVRQYVMFIVVGTVALFVLISIVRSYALAS